MLDIMPDELQVRNINTEIFDRHYSLSTLPTWGLLLS